MWRTSCETFTVAEKVPCAQCGMQILTTTAVKTRGLCRVCERGDQRSICQDCGLPIFKVPGTVNICLACLGKRERQRATSIHAFVESQGAGDCSLLIALYKLDERLRL